MAEERIAKVEIDGREITLTGDETAYMEMIAAYINGKIEELKKGGNYNRQTGEDRRLMLLLNIADDYYREKQRREETERQLARVEEDMDNLRHELVKKQMQREGRKR